MMADKKPARPRRSRKVVGIRGSALPIPQVDADVVATLDALLACAIEGQVVGLIYGTVTPQGHIGTGWAGAEEKYSMIAAGAILQARILAAAADDD